MSGLSRWTTVLGVALALPAVASVLAQDDERAKAVTIKTRKVGGAVVLEEVAPGDGLVVPQDAKPADKAVAQPAYKKPREDILAKAVRAIEKAVAEKKAPVQDVEKVVIMRQAVRFAAAADVADADLDPMAVQWLAQFTPMVRTEVHFLLSVSQANPEQRKAIGAGRNKAAKQASKLYAQSQQRVGRFQNNAQYPQPRNLVQESVTALATPILSAEQIERYKAEVRKRDVDQKSLAIKNIVARMDQDLILTGDQREKLGEVLLKNWNASWCQSLETFMYGDQFFPAIPDNVVLPILNPRQATVWQGTQKNNGMVFGGFGIFNNGVEADDAFPLDEEPEEPKKDAIKAAPAGGEVKVFVMPQDAVEAEKPKAVEKPKDAPKDKEKAAEKPKDAPKDKEKAAEIPKYVPKDKSF